MNTKNKTIAIMLAAIMVSAILVPMAAAQSLPSSATVTSENPQILCKCEGPDDDTNLPGTQIYPELCPGNKTVDICAVVCDPNGKNTISSVVAEIYYPNETLKNITTLSPASSCPNCTLYIPEIAETPTSCPIPDSSNLTCQLYNGSFVMGCCDPAGEYRVHLIATDKNSFNDTFQNRFCYESIIGLDLGFTAIAFGEVTPSIPEYVVPGNIHNQGNDPMNVTVNATNLTRVSGGGVIPATELDVNGSWDLSGAGKQIDGVFECCQPRAVNFSIHAPFGTPTGDYTGTMTFTATYVLTRTVLFDNKDARDVYQYDPITTDTYNGSMTYNVSSGDFNFTATVWNSANYSLIYYADPWPGINGRLIGSDNGTNVVINGNLGSIPIAADFDYDLAGGKCGGGKIWLVPSSDMNTTTVGPAHMTDYHPTRILFEIETIRTP